MSLRKPTDADSRRCSTPRPLRLAVTGGIGSGKSYVCRRLEACGLPIFYCDDEAKHIIRHDAVVRTALTTLIGPEVYATDGTLVKPVLAAYICAAPEQAARVDAIVHPRVAEAFSQWCEEQTAPVVVMECALLYESGFDSLVDVTALVAVDEALRLQRVMARDNVSAEKARAWMALQMPEAEKARRADFLLHNDNDAQLAADIDNLLAHCHQA